MKLKISNWESELWSYVSSGDGMHCPRRDHCESRRSGSGCFNESREYLNGMHCPLRDHCEIRRSGSWCFDDSRQHLNRMLCYGLFSLSSDDLLYSNCDSGFCDVCDVTDFLEHWTPARIFQLLEKLAERFLEKGTVRYPPVPIELGLLADENHPVEVRLLPLRACHGAIWRSRSEWIIQLKEDDPPATKRLTIFHETFHILAHCRTTPVFGKRGGVQGSFNELLADYFSGCVLMPREWVAQRWTEVEDLGRMAEIFDVPKSAMWIKLRELSLI